jgi:hypothetical protein
LTLNKIDRELGYTTMSHRKSLNSYLNAIRSARMNLTMAENQAKHVVVDQKRRLIDHFSKTYKFGASELEDNVSDILI